MAKLSNLLELTIFSLALELTMDDHFNAPLAKPSKEIRIEALKISGLHGRRDPIEIQIRDNKLILVGVNGIGKTTILNIFYFAFTQQWMNLSRLRFDEVAFRINDLWHHISKTEIEAYLYDAERLRRRNTGNHC